MGHHEDDVLEGVSPGPRTILARTHLVGHPDQGLDGGNLGGVDDLRIRQSLDRQRVRGSHPDRLDIGRIATGRTHEGVLTIGGNGQELLGAGTTHRTGHRLDDGIVETETVEDADVGVALGLVGLVEAHRGDVEGVSVHHDELAATQDASARTSLVSVLVLDLVETQWQVLVRGVQVLDHEGEHLLVGRAKQHLRPLAILETEEVVAVLNPATSLLVRIGGEECGEAHLLSSNSSHLLATDGLDLAHHPEAQWQP